MKEIESATEDIGLAMRHQRMDIIRKIIGKVMPVAESNEDERRLKNLKEMRFVINELMDEVFDIAYLLSRPESSLIVAACEAENIITELKEQIKGYEENRN